MKWQIQFYNERRGILAQYDVEASLAADAVRLGWKVVLAEYPSIPRKHRLSLFERAEQIGGQDASGWVVYRIVNDGRQGSPRVARKHVA